MNYYQKFILEATACNPADIDQIEDIMRDARNGILGNLSKDELQREARVSYYVLRVNRGETPTLEL